MRKLIAVVVVSAGMAAMEEKGSDKIATVNYHSIGVK